MGNKRKFSLFLAGLTIGTLLTTLIWWKKPSGSDHWHSAVILGVVLISSIVFGRAGGKYRTDLGITAPGAVGVLLLILMAWKWPNASSLWDVAIMGGLSLIYLAISARQKRQRNENIPAVQ